MRRIVAVVVAALALFSWGAVSHMVLGLGDAGLQSVPASADEALAALPSHGMTESGLFFFPSFPKEMQSDPAAQQAWADKAQVQPSGIVVYFPKDHDHMTGATFGIELLTDLAMAALALFLLCCASGCCTTLVSRVLFVAMLGAFAAIARDVPFWNWYGFPATFTVAQIVDSIVGMAIAGLVLALIARKDLDATCERD